MRAVLTTLGTTDDVQSFLSLAAELRRAGHQPVLALSSGFAETARRIGVEFVAIGTNLPSADLSRVNLEQARVTKCKDLEFAIRALEEARSLQ